jgi:uncharacterized RDD family membrane protein YckC
MEKRIGFGKRLGSLLVDWILAILGAVVVGVLLGQFVYRSMGYNVEPGDYPFLPVVSILILLAPFMILYELIEGFTGASPGKMILGIKIRNIDGSKAGLIKLLFRYFLKHIHFWFMLISGLVQQPFLLIIGFILSFIFTLGGLLILGESKQTLHDKIALTAVYSH